MWGAPRVEAAALLVRIGEGGEALGEVRCETHQGECWLVVWSGEGLQDNIVGSLYIYSLYIIYIINVSSYLHCTGVTDSGILVNKRSVRASSVRSAWLYTTSRCCMGLHCSC